MIRVLVVDDSRTMRALIRQVLERDPAIKVVGEAGTALEARELVKTLSPDVMTLDVEMPGMDGLDFLSRVMRLRPMPVVMVSTLTERGTAITLQALELGAVDCVAKPSLADKAAFATLPDIVHAASTARPRVHEASRAPPAESAFSPNGRIVAIGASTGGVEALLEVISRFPANCPPTVITQHMPASFTRSFAQRLNRSSAAQVSEACDGDVLKPGHVFLAPGGPAHLTVSGHGPMRCRLVKSDTVNGHRPSVDVLFGSVAKAAGKLAVGAILTGMGRDGATGLLAMRSAGARTLGQDQASSVVYGMPKVAWEMAAVERQLPITAIAREILASCNVQQRETTPCH